MKIDIKDCDVELFFETMVERQKIWKRKTFLKLSPPWSGDEILRDYKFTNVYRELDRNSQWQINNIFKKKQKSKFDLVWKILLFRIFNQPDFFEFIGTQKGSFSDFIAEL